jgi:hypothetical protein
MDKIKDKQKIRVKFFASLNAHLSSSKNLHSTPEWISSIKFQIFLNWRQICSSSDSDAQHLANLTFVLFGGIAGLGSVGGRLYLVDLALDEANKSKDVNMYFVCRNCRSGYSGRARVPGGHGPGRGQQREHGR